MPLTRTLLTQPSRLSDRSASTRCALVRSVVVPLSPQVIRCDCVQTNERAAEATTLVGSRIPAVVHVVPRSHADPRESSLAMPSASADHFLFGSYEHSGQASIRRGLGLVAVPHFGTPSSSVIAACFLPRVLFYVGRPRRVGHVCDCSNTVRSRAARKEKGRRPFHRAGLGCRSTSYGDGERCSR